MTRYKSVSIPEKLHKVAENNIEDHGYTSVPDLVKDLLRDWIKDIQNIKRMQQQQQKGDEIMNNLVTLAEEGKDEELSEAIIQLAGEDERE